MFSSTGGLDASASSAATFSRRRAHVASYRSETRRISEPNASKKAARWLSPPSSACALSSSASSTESTSSSRPRSFLSAWSSLMPQRASSCVLIAFFRVS